MAMPPGPGAQSKEVVFDLDAVAFSSDHFRMHEFKVKRCPRARPHDWTQCPFAHPGEKARRRDPRRYRYSGTACPEFRKSGCCRRGDACPFAHGVFECWLHPSRYRTQLCTDGTSCKRRVCFFAHSESELRRPEDDPVVAQCQVQAELAAEVQTLQQQHLTQALSALLEAKEQPTQGGTAGLPGGQLNLLTLELLKQANPATQTLESNGESTAGNPSLQLALIQQLALVEQVQKQQQQQREQAQQLLSTLNGQGNSIQGADPKGLQALLAAVSQNSLQESLTNQLTEQLKTHNPALDALNLLAGGAVHAENQQSSPSTGSEPRPTDTMNSMAGLGVHAEQAQSMGVSAAMAMNGTTLGFEIPGSVVAGVPVEQNTSLQMPGQSPHLHASGFMSTVAPGQLATVRARAALAGGRRSIDNGVLARSVSDLMGALESTNLGTHPSQISSLTGDTANGHAMPMGYSVPVPGATQAQSLDTNGVYAGWSSEEALKQAKSLLENLSLLQGGKNGSSGTGLLHSVNMETLLNANGMSAMNRITSFDKMLEDLPKSVSEVGPPGGVQLLPRATYVAGGDML